MNGRSVEPTVLESWLREIGFAGRTARVELEPMSGDVSPRRYFRASCAGRRAIVAWYPPEVRQAGGRFLRTGDLLRAAGVRVPVVLASELERGLMALEDLGEDTLFDRRHRPWPELAPAFALACEAARRIAALDPACCDHLLPPLDREPLERELAQTWDVFLEPQGLTGSGSFQRRLRACFERLCAELGAGPLRPCHRDFMARNLVPLGSGSGAELAVLDHQDLRLGPEAYDLASLFNDSIFPEQAAVAQALGSDLHRSAGYHRAVAQRCIKAVGTFASFARRGDSRHLPLIPRTLRRGLDHLAAIEEGAPLAAELERRWMAAMEPPPLC